MWSVIGDVLIGVVVIGVVTALAMLGGPIRNAAVGTRAKNLRTPATGLTERGERPPPQFPGPFFPGG
jgi:hypothetical protein